MVGQQSDSQRTRDKAQTSPSRSALFHGPMWGVLSGLPVKLWARSYRRLEVLSTCSNILATMVKVTSFLP